MNVSLQLYQEQPICLTIFSYAPCRKDQVDYWEFAFIFYQYTRRLINSEGQLNMYVTRITFTLNCSIIIVYTVRMHVFILEYTSSMFYGITIGKSAIHNTVFHTFVCYRVFLCLLCFSVCPFVVQPHRYILYLY